MLGARDDGEEPLQQQLEAVLRFLDRDVRHRRLWSDEELERRHEAEQEGSIRSERLLHIGAPRRDRDVTLAQDVFDEVLQRLGDRRVGDVALVRIELAPREERASGREHGLEVVDERRLSDPRVAGDQRELRGTALDTLQRRS